MPKLNDFHISGSINQHVAIMSRIAYKFQCVASAGVILLQYSGINNEIDTIIYLCNIVCKSSHDNSKRLGNNSIAGGFTVTGEYYIIFISMVHLTRH